MWGVWLCFGCNRLGLGLCGVSVSLSEVWVEGFVCLCYSFDCGWLILVGLFCVLLLWGYCLLLFVWLVRQ